MLQCRHTKAKRLYGVLAYLVERRTSEIGVRMALGADRGSVIGMVLGGVLAGRGRYCTWHSCRDSGWQADGGSQLVGVEPWDPVMLSLATVLLGLGALLASVIPAWRAAGVQPMVALRNE
jgi:putative ABC transport system permease protein